MKNEVLEKLEFDYFDAIHLSTQSKKKIFSEIKNGILLNRKRLEKLITKEVKLIQKDAIREVERAIETFDLAEKNAGYTIKKKIVRNGKIITEQNIARGPLLAITPFSSPISSPAHKVALGILSGTSILFKPSRNATLTGKAFFEIVSNATKSKYVYFCDSSDKELNDILSDERIGIVSFTGSYETGVKIIRNAGAKKYHMELSGGNSSVIFTPDYQQFSTKLIEKLLDGFLAKNGQRCVSIKHIFVPKKQKRFLETFLNRLDNIKKEIKNDSEKSKKTILGTMITRSSALLLEKKVNNILKKHPRKIIPFIKIEREEDFLFPSAYRVVNFDRNLIKNLLDYDLSGPVLFFYVYKNQDEYLEIIKAFEKDYTRSGIQLSFFTNNIASIENLVKDIVWGGIVVNDIPTLRDEFMSFGGFGRAGIGKEGFFATIHSYTDPKIITYNTKTQ